MKKVVLILAAIVSIVGCAVAEEPRPTIEIFTDEGTADTKIAVVIIADGSLELQVSDETSPEILELKTALEEISSKETLPLEVEHYVDGNYVLVFNYFLKLVF